MSSRVLLQWREIYVRVKRRVRARSTRDDSSARHRRVLRRSI